MRRIIIMGKPHHGNLGDQAIYSAELNMLNKYFTEYEICSVHEEHLVKCLEKIKKYINDDDIIMMHGGGNLGDTYVDPENGRRAVIKNFPNNKIILFPQTAYFSNTEKGKKELELSKKIYNKHNNLVILARENRSYEFIKANFTNAKVYLTPDIVMTLKFDSNVIREGALLLFRADKEKVLENETINNIIEIIKKEYKKCKLTDMNIDTLNIDTKKALKKKYEKYKLYKNGMDEIISNISDELREKLLQEKFQEFKSSEIVVTDRLHGMIFSAITQTPCIVFGSMDYKIIESYKWLKKYNYIKYCNNIEEFTKALEELKNNTDAKYDNEFAEHTIANILKEEIMEEKKKCLN